MRLVENEAMLIDTEDNISLLSASPSIEEAQKLVEGWVEALRFERDGVKAQALFNEEGLRKDMVPNLMASVLVGTPLVGPVIILTGNRRWE
jgi:hypothetical protein